MRRLLFSAFLIPLLVAACGSSSNTGTDALTDGSSDSATCTGAPPAICNGCCGAKYAANDCQSGVWSCRPLGIACAVCDAGSTDSAADDASGDASAVDDASGDGATCPGTPPILCNGCCGAKYAADNCQNGVWSCRPLAAACVRCDAGATTDSAAADAAGEASAVHDASSDAAICTGTAPLCFGNNVSLCCGRDPSGSAVCTGGAWMCGSAPAPGCNGTSCFLQDAGPG